MKHVNGVAVNPPEIGGEIIMDLATATFVVLLIGLVVQIIVAIKK